MSETPEAPVHGRREFLKLVGAAGLASTLQPATALFAQTPPPATGGAPGTPPAAAPAPTGPSEEAKALTALLKKRFPDRLTDEQWADVTEDLDGNLGDAKRLKATKLANGDEPDFTFHA